MRKPPDITLAELDGLIAAAIDREPATTAERAAQDYWRLFHPDSGGGAAGGLVPSPGPLDSDEFST